MKIRFYPRKELVLKNLETKFDRLAGECGDLLTELERFKASGLYAAPEVQARKESALQAAEEERDQVALEIQLLTSHEPPEVMAELEV